jgi:hypothetical protein
MKGQCLGGFVAVPITGRKGRNEGRVCGSLCTAKGYCPAVSGPMHTHALHSVPGDDEGIAVAMAGANRGGLKEVRQWPRPASDKRRCSQLRTRCPPPFCLCVSFFGPHTSSPASSRLSCSSRGSILIATSRPFEMHSVSVNGCLRSWTLSQLPLM